MLKKIFITGSFMVATAISMAYEMETPVGQSREVVQDFSHNSSYSSLADLKEKSSVNNDIKFLHQLSEFTYSKMKPDLLGYFKQYGGLVDSDSNPGPGVKIVENFAIAPKSMIYKLRFGICLGQDIKTKEFLAFKLVLRAQDHLYPAGNLREIHWLKEFNRFRGILDAKGIDMEGVEEHEKPEFYYIAMSLVDGLNFSELSKLTNKITPHVRYLIAYNIVATFRDFTERSIQQCDVIGSNFMVCASDFDFKIVDFGWMEQKTSDYTPRRAYFWADLFTKIFCTGSDENISISNLKAYQHGPFEKLLKFIEERAKNQDPRIYVDEIIELLPNLT